VGRPGRAGTASASAITCISFYLYYPGFALEIPALVPTALPTQSLAEIYSWVACDTVRSREVRLSLCHDRGTYSGELSRPFFEFYTLTNWCLWNRFDGAVTFHDLTLMEAPFVEPIVHSVLFAKFDGPNKVPLLEEALF